MPSRPALVNFEGRPTEKLLTSCFLTYVPWFAVAGSPDPLEVLVVDTVPVPWVRGPVGPARQYTPVLPHPFSPRQHQAQPKRLSIYDRHRQELNLLLSFILTIILLHWGRSASSYSILLNSIIAIIMIVLNCAVVVSRVHTSIFFSLLLIFS